MFKKKKKKKPTLVFLRHKRLTELPISFYPHVHSLLLKYVRTNLKHSLLFLLLYDIDNALGNNCEWLEDKYSTVLSPY